MLARRLLALVAVLMGITLLAAIVTPAPRQPAPPASTATPGATGAADDDTIEITLDTSDGQHEAEVEEGDHVRLVVRSDAADSVEISGLDLIRTVAPDTPAEFDLLADAPGQYPIVLIGAGATIGTLRVSPRAG